jgi:hypothetical protein
MLGKGTLHLRDGTLLYDTPSKICFSIDFCNLTNLRRGISLYTCIGVIPREVERWMLFWSAPSLYPDRMTGTSAPGAVLQGIMHTAWSR